jgi:DNA-binding MarR family transcriptional regulator
VSARVDRGRAFAEQLGLAVIRSRRHVWRVVASALAERGESMLDWQLVAQLVRGGALTQRALAEAVAQHPAGVSRQLSLLERKGLTRRARSQADRRCSLVELTPVGERWYRTYHPTVVDAVGGALGELTSEEQRQLFGLLKKLLGETP